MRPPTILAMTVSPCISRRCLLLTCFALLWALPAAAQTEAASAAPKPLPVVYTNTQYGFCFLLPESWKGYTILPSTWSAGSPDGKKQMQGPLLRLRNPKWTADAPYEDIPIMVFTRGQWRRAIKNGYIFGAAPIGPRELTHNRHYLFALPARYNFDMATGYEEVEALLDHGSLQTPCGHHTPPFPTDR